jgi:hypothetical protein
MSAINHQANFSQQLLRWIARMLSLLSTGLLLLFLLGEPLEMSRITARQLIGFVLFPVGVVVGFALAWWREIPGALISIAAVIVLCLVYIRDISKSWAFFVFACPALLFLASGLLSRAQRRLALSA